MKLETETWNLKFKIEIQTWNSNLKLKLEIKTWNWNLKLKLEIETWNLNSKFRLEIETALFLPFRVFNPKIEGLHELDELGWMVCPN